jgi:hypothetical protein
MRKWLIKAMLKCTVQLFTASNHELHELVNWSRHHIPFGQSALSVQTSIHEIINDLAKSKLLV